MTPRDAIPRRRHARAGSILALSLALAALVPVGAAAAQGLPGISPGTPAPQPAPRATFGPAPTQDGLATPSPRPARPAPIWLPQASPQSGPPASSPASSGTPAPRPAASAPAQPATPRPRPTRSPGPAVTAASPRSSPAPAATATPVAPASATPALPPVTPSVAPAPPPVAEPGTEDASSLIAMIVPAVVALVAGLGGGWVLASRRARRRPPPDAIAEAEPPPPPAPAAPRPEAPVTAPTDATPPGPAHDPDFQLACVPERLTVSLIMATLRYRLTLANAGALPLGDVMVQGEMIAAHAALGEAAQIGFDGADLPELHRIAGLAPGESHEWTGDLRLPLAAIEPLRVADAALFVPLLRISATALGDGGDGRVAQAVVAVGEPPVGSGERLRPFRLDLGPRLYTAIAGRLLAP